MIATTRPVRSVNESVLYVAFELGKREWKLAMTSGFGVAPLRRTVASGDWRAIDRALAAGRQRVGLPAASPVVSCYEAGRDGFWIHRGAGGARDSESRRGFVEHRGESPGAADQNGSAGRDQTGADARAGLPRRAGRVEGSAGASAGGRSGAAYQSRAHRADAGDDAAGESNAELPGDVRRGLAAAAGGRLVGGGAGLGGRGVAGIS
jgi:hypothetical protein